MSDHGRSAVASDEPNHRPAGSWLDVAREHGWLAIWLTLVATPLAIRDPLPPDELRYLAVAWEMWSRGDFILPYLNGDPYDDKGPLLFWFMHLGWGLFGVNDWWPRSLPGIFALTAIFAARRLARELWPDAREAIAALPWLLLGTFAWVLYTQAVLFDLLLVNCTLLGLIGLVRAEHGAARAWPLVAAATALGLLTKGPAMLLHLAAAGLLAPWWRQNAAVTHNAWYSRLGLALLAGALLALAWAALATLRGGAAYAENILVHQTTGRVVASFAHARPFWYYAAVLPLLLMPWTAWPAAWRAVRASLAGGALEDAGWRMLGLTIVLTFVAFSALSGKQPHYLLPIVPLIAMLLAVALAGRAQARTSAWLPAGLCGLAALGVALVPLTAVAQRLAVTPWSPRFALAAGVAALLMSGSGPWSAVAKRLALCAPLVALGTEIAFFGANRAAYGTNEAAAFVRRLEDDGHPIAYVGAYAGELHFPGRLEKPIDVLGDDPSALADWARAHPDGYVISDDDAPVEGAAFTQRLRGQWLSIERVARR